MPNSSRAVFGKSRFLSVIFDRSANSRLCSDHSASEILKSPILPGLGLPVTSAAKMAEGDQLRLRAAAPAKDPLRNERRVRERSAMGEAPARGRRKPAKDRSL